MSRKASAHVLGEGEVGVPVAGIVVVVEDAADAARLLAVGEEEILVAPVLVALDSRRPGAASQAACMAAWKSSVSGSSWVRRASSTGVRSPPPPNHQLAGDDHARVHVHGRHMRVPGVADQRNARGSRMRRLLRCPGSAWRNLGRKVAVDGRDVNARLFEDAAMQHRHLAAAARR